MVIEFWQIILRHLLFGEMLDVGVTGMVVKDKSFLLCVDISHCANYAY